MYKQLCHYSDCIYQQMAEVCLEGTQMLQTTLSLTLTTPPTRSSTCAKLLFLEFSRKVPDLNKILIFFSESLWLLTRDAVPNDATVETAMGWFPSREKRYEKKPFFPGWWGQTTFLGRSLWEPNRQDAKRFHKMISYILPPIKLPFSSIFLPRNFPVW